jgi:hypothetical protein
MQPTRTLLPLFALAAFAAAQDAQDPLLAARQKLQKSLAAMAALPSCAFDARWAVDDAGKKKDDTNVVVFGVTDPGGDAKGAWGDGALYLQSGDDEVFYAGRRMLARQSGGEWALRRGRYQNGATLEFQPDPQPLFQILSAMDLAVVHREAGALHDRPVEALTVTLNHDQVAELAHAGLLPQSVTGSTALNGMVFAFAAGGGKAARTAPPASDATVDLVFHLDPGTGMIHRMVVRGTTKNDVQGGHVVFGGAAGAVRVVRAGGGGGDDDEDKEKEDAKEPAKDAPLQYKDGLPQRPRKKMQVYDYAIDLRDHGRAQLPALDDKQKALLGR